MKSGIFGLMAFGFVLGSCQGDGAVVLPDGGDVYQDADSQSDGGADQVDGSVGSDADNDADVAVEESIEDPCVNVSCPQGQQCLEGNCVNQRCEDLNCVLPYECQVLANGGALCVDIGCSEDIQCSLEQFCNGTICVDDVCQAGSERCDSNVVQRCASNGQEFEKRFDCSVSAVGSQCVEDGQNNAFCTCDDDWDCPQWVSCEVGLCVGTGYEPTCRLEPEPFDNVLPQVELMWGSEPQSNQMAGGPFAESTQVVMTPLVANLNDDNGDGLINESDFPELVFLSFRNSDYKTNGILRAIHGGGPNKGKDYFAVCGSTVWHAGDPEDLACDYKSANLDSTASPAVGDLDNDRLPEIVAISETDEIVIFSHTGEIISSYATSGLGGQNPAVSLANVDNQGLVEIVIGNNLFSLVLDDSGQLKVQDQFSGDQTSGTNGQGPISCVADLVGDQKLEIVAGTTVYRWPEPPAGVTSTKECDQSETDPDHIAWCASQLLVVWDANSVNGGIDAREGFCAVADVFGADLSQAPGPANPLDQKPEVLVIADGYLEIFQGDTGQLIQSIPLAPGTRGGAPNIDDFDGDGFPELGTAFLTEYILYDFQPASAACPAWPDVLVDDQPMPQANLPRLAGGADCTQDEDCLAGEAVCNRTISKCVCLHNGWRRQTEDDSSRVTGSSVFDFNGDGAVEVIYNDECRFRIYNGLDGEVEFSEPSESRTRIEYPVVADVDSDGNAEIVFGTSNESGFCSEGLLEQYNAGIEVWGDAGDYWVSARRIWNQHSYHVTNVKEDGSIPFVEPKSWVSHNGRLYNTYRSNPRNYNTAPDLTPTAIQFASPDATCGQLSSKLDINVQLDNAGDLIVGPLLVVAFEGFWSNPDVVERLLDENGNDLIYQIQAPLEPADSTIISVHYDIGNNNQDRLPDQIRAIVDANQRERECLEDNNSILGDVQPGEQAADLRVELGEASIKDCPDPKVQVTVYNEGSKPASDILVRFFAGNPDQGGVVLLEKTLPDPLAPTEHVVFTVSFPSAGSRPITLYAKVDPDNSIVECDDGDNLFMGPQIQCYPD